MRIMKTIEAIFLTIIMLSSVNCAGDGILPQPKNVLYHPFHITANPAHSDYLYLVNANYDQRYDRAVLSVIDLQAIRTGGEAIYSEGSLFIPSFGGQFSISADGTRGILPIRGEQGFVIVNISEDGSQLSCASDDCTADIQIFDPLDFSIDLIAEESRGYYSSLLIDRGNYEQLFISTLMNSLVFPFSWKKERGAIPEPSPGLYFGGGGLADLLYNPEQDIIYAASQRPSSSDVESRIFTIEGEYQEDTTPTAHYISISSQFAGNEVNALAMTEDGRLLAANSVPNSLIFVDVNNSSFDAPYGLVIDAIPLEGEPGDMILVPQSNGKTYVYITLLTRDVIAVIDLDTGQTIHRLYTGAGPFSLSYTQLSTGEQWLCVTEFYDHTLAIFDISSPDPQQQQLVTRINEGAYEESIRFYQ